MKVRSAVAFAGLIAAVALLAPLSSSAGDRGSGGSDVAGTAFSAVSSAVADSHAGNARTVDTENAPTFTLDRGDIAATLPDSSGSAEISLPAPDGSVQSFEIAPNEVMAPKLAAAHPEIETFAGRGIDDRSSTIRITRSPLGFQASVRGGELGSWYIDPTYHLDQSLYSSYYGPDLANRHGPLGELAPEGSVPASARVSEREATAGRGLSNGTQLRTYRLALISEPGYSKYFGGPANVTAAKVALMNRVDQVYESEQSITMVLIGDNDDLNLDTYAEAIAPNGPCGNAPCYDLDEVTSCSGATLDQNRIVAGSVVGADKFDIAHIALGQPGGGIAGLGVVGRKSKAAGCTGIPKPDGDFYAVDYVAHEMGHQFSGNHTFNGNQVNCSGGNRNGGTSVEPGSGSSIMAYAGICGQDNLQPHSDPYFSQRSFQEITTYVGSNQSAISEVQAVALRNFGGGNEVQTATFGPKFNEDSSAGTLSSFKLSFNGQQSATIGGTGGAPFTNSGIAGAINAIPGFAGTVTVSGASATSNTFDVTFGGASAGLNVPNLQIVGLTGCASCFGSIEEARHGGANDSFKLTFDGNTSGTITRGTNYNIAGLDAAIAPLVPAGVVASVAGIGGGAVGDDGFQVTFTGTATQTAIADLVETTDESGTVASVSNRLDSGGPVSNKGNTVTPTGNTAPVVTTPGTVTIPHRTPFTLAGSATDGDSDPLTYMWEQNDRGLTATSLVKPNKISGPLFRQFGTRLDELVYDEHAYDSPGENHTTADPSRTFPDIDQILDDNTNAATGDCPGAPAPEPPATGGATNVPDKLADCYSEFLPKAAYTGPMHFRLTARDGLGGVGSEDTTVRLAPATGPFLVTAPNTNVDWLAGSTREITWDVAGTRGNGIGATDVKISLSTNGGQSFPTVLAATTANDGSAQVTLPASDTNKARIKVEGVGNVFFDVSDKDFRISPAPAPVVADPESLKVRYGGKGKTTIVATDPDSPGSALTAQASGGVPNGFELKKTGDSGNAALPGTATFSLSAKKVKAKTKTYRPSVVVKDGGTTTGEVGLKIVVKRAKVKLKKVAVKPSKPRSGKRATFKVKVKAPDSALKPSGKVKFKLGNRTLGNAKVRGGVAKIRKRVEARPGRAKLKAKFSDSNKHFQSKSAQKRIRIR